MFLNVIVFILLSWMLLFLIFTGIGLLPRIFFGLKIQNAESVLNSFWIGWAFTIFFLQLWHFYFPVNQYAFVLISVFGAVGLIFNRTELLQLIKGLNLKKWIFLFVLLLTVFWIANHAILTPLKYDSGLYHFSAVRWAGTFPVVPGLGNMMGHLAYNQSYFLYVALLDNAITVWKFKSHHLANGILLAVLSAQIFLSIWKVKGREKFKLYDFFNLLILIPVLSLVYSMDLSSPAPDLSIFILGMVISAQLLAFLESSKSFSNETGYHLFSIAVLAMAGLLVKANFFPFGVICLLVALGVWFYRNGFKDIKIIIPIAAVIAFALIPWFIRSIIMTGYIAYPLPFGSFPVEWQIPRPSVENMRNWNLSWARTPEVHWSEVLGKSEWFYPWIWRTLSNLDVIATLLLMFSGCCFIFWYGFTKKQNPKYQNTLWLFLLPSILSLMFWFFTMPDPRFATVYFWISAIGVLTLAYHYCNRDKIVMRSFIILFSVIFFMSPLFLLEGKWRFIKIFIKSKNISAASKPLSLKKDLFVEPGPNRGFYDIPSVPLKEFVTDSGLVLFIPDDRCWNAPLPCTKYRNKNLRLRNKSDMRYGFMLEPKGRQDANVGIH